MRKWWKSGASGAVFSSVFERILMCVGVRKESQSGARREGAVLENSGRAPYPTPKLGISARHAVSNLSGCGGGAPHPIVTPHPWHSVSECLCQRNQDRGSILGAAVGAVCGQDRGSILGAALGAVCLGVG